MLHNEVVRKRRVSFGSKLQERIHAGERRTIGEWALELDLSEKEMRNRLTHARRAGYMLFPVTTYGGKAEPLVDIMESMSDFRSVIGNYDQGVMKHMLAAFETIERGFNQYPQLRAVLRKELERITHGADDGSRTILLSEGKVR